MIELTPIGQVESELTDRALAPKQGFEGAPDAWLVFEPSVLDGLEGIAPGAEVIVLTWLHRADRDVLRVHPRDDVANPLTGMLGARAPPTARIRSACTRCRSWRSKVRGSGCAASRPSTARRSSTSSQCCTRAGL